MDKIRELDGISDEEDWSVVSDHIPVTLFGIEFDSITSWISGGISRSFFTSDSRESKEDWSGFSDLAEEFSFGVFTDIMGGFEESVSTCTFSMYDSFWNSLSIEMGQFVNQMDVI